MQFFVHRFAHLFELAGVVALDAGQPLIERTAQLLGLRRTTLVEKLRKYGIDREQNETP